MRWLRNYVDLFTQDRLFLNLRDTPPKLPRGALPNTILWVILFTVGTVGFGLVTAVLAASAARDPAARLLGFFVRKEAKRHGLGKRIEGGFDAGQTVALLEDTVTTGGSTLEALRVVESAGGKVTRVLCLIDRGEGATEAFGAHGIVLESLFGRGDLPE